MNLNTSFHLRDKGVSNALMTGEVPRHRWYFVKEGFSPALVEQAMKTECVKKGELVIDPFVGSGTTPLAAVSSGMRAVGIEVNPFLRFLSAAKLTQVNPARLGDSASVVGRGLLRPSPSRLETYSTFGEGNRWNRWLFSRDVLRAFEGALNHIRMVPTRHRGLLMLALLSAAMDCCNAVRDGKCLRYRKDWRDKQRGVDDLVSAFSRRVAVIIEDLKTAPLRDADATITQGDARRSLRERTAGAFRLCITSPPYLNSFDYSDVYRPELFLGRFVDSNASLMRIRLRTIRSHVQATWSTPHEEDFGHLYRECMDKVRSSQTQLWSSRLPLMIQAYFEDMRDVLMSLRECAARNASTWMVVSTSAYAGIEIPVDLILAEIGQAAGWYLREVGVLRYLRSSGQQMNGLASGDHVSVPLRESVIVLQTQPSSSH
ncbi:MAG: DNA methyltransferase [candidate division WOR-3 bacterium]|nr:DNA methyltransferase [candidate division WOR-3 bacterium]